ncbi:hypothetical protein GCM10010515_23080 [Streptomyces fructofermentans]|uniref:Uncharacterized protein n=1 Tax=Streptomyces fructofermentans TaxID=152141 RepID=A0A918K8W2_9ACTN|nr:hypothetical protein GCM10010515_23080 [Streptomyces fructofermentans]
MTTIRRASATSCLAADTLSPMFGNVRPGVPAGPVRAIYVTGSAGRRRIPGGGHPAGPGPRAPPDTARPAFRVTGA